MRHADGLGSYSRPRWRYLLGHHFAAIAGAGPLVGHVLAAQMGYLPGTLWLLGGAVFAGAVQDFRGTHLLRSVEMAVVLGDIIRAEMGRFAGAVAGIGIVTIVMILWPYLTVVIKALTGAPGACLPSPPPSRSRSPWGFIGASPRPGRVGETSADRLALLLSAICPTAAVAARPLGCTFHPAGYTLALMLMPMACRRRAARLAVSGAARLSIDLP